MTSLNIFSTLLDRFRSTSWPGIFEDTKRLRSFLLRISLVVAQSFSSERGIVCFVIAKRVYQLSRKSGLLFTALYLKQCSTLLMQYYAASEKKVRGQQISGTFVSLSKAGIPRIIPFHHRHIISKRDDRADSLVRLYLSLFSVCRIIKLAKPLKVSSFADITRPIPDIEMVKEVHGMIKQSFSSLWPLYLPHLKSIPLRKGFRWLPTWKSTPNCDNQFSDVKERPSIFSAMKYEVAAFASQLRLIHSWEGVFSPAILFFGGVVLYPLDNKFTTEIANQDLEKYEAWPGLVFDQLASAFTPYVLYPGRLSQSLEGAGKRRLFVIGNYFKQRLLSPVHDWAMSVLRTLPTDGTFHQLRPIHRLSGSTDLYSLDLKSATDRWPVSTIHDLVACIFGPTLASCIVNGCLALNACYVGKILKSYPHNLCFVAGQPLGYYGSWALFALTHHYVVWLAADRVNPNRRKPFLDYALLGDDIVIADKAVAAEYRSILNLLQVTVSEAKSLVSSSGALEFAKQFWVKGVTKNLSPISARAVLQSYSVLGVQQLTRAYGLSEKTSLRLSGAGYRTLGKLGSRKNLSRKFERVLALCNKQVLQDSQLSIEWWLGRGQPLSPYSIGEVIGLLRAKTRLQQLTTLPFERYSGEGEQTQVENTLLRNHMALWLEYLAWYVRVHSDSDVRIDHFLKPPIITFGPYVDHDPEVRKYRRMWSVLYQCYDLVAHRSPGWGPYAVTANWPMLEE